MPLENLPGCSEPQLPCRESSASCLGRCSRGRVAVIIVFTVKFWRTTALSNLTDRNKNTVLVLFACLFKVALCLHTRQFPLQLCLVLHPSRGPCGEGIRELGEGPGRPLLRGALWSGQPSPWGKQGTKTP